MLESIFRPALDFLALTPSRVYRPPSHIGSNRFQLVPVANGLSNAVSLCKYTDLRDPVNGVRCANASGPCIDDPHPHALLQTVRIPLADFGSVDLTKVRGVRFSFNNTSSGAINLANIRFTRGQ